MFSKMIICFSFYNDRKLSYVTYDSIDAIFELGYSFWRLFGADCLFWFGLDVIVIFL